MYSLSIFQPPAMQLYNGHETQHQKIKMLTTQLNQALSTSFLQSHLKTKQQPPRFSRIMKLEKYIALVHQENS